MSRLAHHCLTLCVAALAAGIAAGLAASGQTQPLPAVVLGVCLFALALLMREAIVARERRLVLEEMANTDHATFAVTRHRLEQVEIRLKALEMAASRSDGDQAAVEIATLGTLVKDLAEGLAAQEGRLATLAGLAAPIAPPRPAQPASSPPAPLPEPVPEPEPEPMAPLVPAAPAVDRDVVEAIEAGRVEFHLQPVVTLPQRKPRLYEVLPHVRLGDGRLLAAPEFMPTIAALDQTGVFDRHQLLRTRQILRRLASRSRDLALVVNLSPRSLSDRLFLDEALELARTVPDLVPQLVFELQQAGMRTLDDGQLARLRALVAAGYRLSMDAVADLRLDPLALAAQGFRLVKVPAAVLLGQPPAGLPIRIEDLAGLLARHGLDLVADGIEAEATVLDLLDVELRFGQGDLFAPPRPVRTDVAEEPAPPAPRPPPAAPPSVASSPAAPPRTLGEAALHEAIDRLRARAPAASETAPATDRPPSAWRTLARRVPSQRG